MIAKPIRSLWGQAFLAFLPFLAAVSAAAQVSEQWYVVSMAGQPVGSIVERRSEEEGEVLLKSEMRLVINRLGNKVEMGTDAAFRELPDGRLRGVDVDLKMSTQVTSTHATVEEGTVRIRSGTGEQSFERSVPFTGALLGPEGIARLSASPLPGGIEAQTFSAEMGGVVRVKRRVLGRETLRIEGAEVAVHKVEEEVSGYPAKRTLWLDSAGRLVASEEPGPFGVMRVERAGAAAARRAAEGGELPAEAYGGTIVRTQIRLPSPRRLEWVKLRLLHRNPNLGWPDFERSGQRVVEKTAKSLVLEVARPKPAAGLPFPVAPTAATAEFLEANAFIQSNDPAIRAKALEIVGGERDLFQAALKLERWVAESMTFDLGIAMAPASELFKDRRGTCAGYATLLATLVRAAGIPARYMLGYVYVDGMFGGHAWVEVLAGDRWVPLDAAIVASGAADAARFAFQASSLREGAGALNTGGALQMFGQIDLQVLGYALEGGERVAVPPDAKPYRVEGDLYRNTGLGIELRKPAGFRFVDLDGVWPEKTLVGMAGPAGERITLESHRRYPWEGEEAVRERLAGEGAVVFPRAGEAWLLRAEGPGAAALVKALAEGLRLP